MSARSRLPTRIPSDGWEEGGGTSEGERELKEVVERREGRRGEEGGRSMNEVSDDCMHLHTYILYMHCKERHRALLCCQEAVEDCVSYVVCYPIHTLDSYIYSMQSQ